MELTFKSSSLRQLKTYKSLLHIVDQFFLRLFSKPVSKSRNPVTDPVALVSLFLTLRSSADNIHCWQYGSRVCHASFHPLNSINSIQLGFLICTFRASCYSIRLSWAHNWVVCPHSKHFFFLTQALGHYSSNPAMDQVDPISWVKLFFTR